jgi:hypothetical protein
MSKVIRKTPSTSQRSSTNYSHSHPSNNQRNDEERIPYDQRYSRKRTNRNNDEEDEVEEFQSSSKSSKRSNRKELCDLGMTCPYINEYQHRLEFDHDEQETIPSSTRRPSPSSSRIPFAGHGNILGGYCVRSERNIGNNPMSKRHERLPSNMPTKKQKKNYEQSQFDSPSDSSSATATGNQQESLHVTCDICHKAIDIYNWDMHALSHERNQREQDSHHSPHPHQPEIVSLVSPEPKNSSNRNQSFSSKPSPRTSLRSEQDRDYESAVMEDILKQSKLEFEQFQKNQKNLETKEDEILNGLLQTTSITQPPSSTRSFRSLKATGECHPSCSLPTDIFRTQDFTFCCSPSIESGNPLTSSSSRSICCFSSSSNCSHNDIFFIKLINPSPSCPYTEPNCSHIFYTEHCPGRLDLRFLFSSIDSLPLLCLSFSLLGSLFLSHFTSLSSWKE